MAWNNLRVSLTYKGKHRRRGRRPRMIEWKVEKVISAEQADSRKFHGFHFSPSPLLSHSAAKGSRPWQEDIKASRKKRTVHCPLVSSDSKQFLARISIIRLINTFLNFSSFCKGRLRIRISEKSTFFHSSFLWCFKNMKL